MIKEGLNLPKELEIECNRLAEYIASMFLPYFKKRIQHTKTKSDESIVKYHEYYRLATEYKKNKQYFYVNKSSVDSIWGSVSFFISSKNNVLPRIFVKITNGYTSSVDGYVSQESKDMFLLVDTLHFVKYFKKSTEQLRETIKHESRHIFQLSNMDIKGLPKKDVRDTGQRDVFGYNLKGSGRGSHVTRDIEFKPNVHTYAFHIKNHLNRFYNRSDWDDGFNKLISNEDRNSKSTELNDVLEGIDSLKRYNFDKWKQFVKEIYKDIFL